MGHCVWLIRTLVCCRAYVQQDLPLVEAGTTEQPLYAFDNKQLAEVAPIELLPELPPAIRGA